MLKKYDIEKTLSLCQKTIGYNFKNENYLLEAITHRTFANENRKKKYNQRLEFLGDSVLSLIVSEYLFKNYKNCDEGLLSKIKSHLVSSGTLSRLSKELKLGDFLLLGKGEEISGGRYKDNMLEDLFEAIVGAVYLDSDIIEAKKFVRFAYGEIFDNLDINNFYKDYKTIFQETMQKKYKTNPKYRTSEYDEIFKSEVFLRDKIYGVGFGKSKKEAEIEAAKDALIGIKNKSKENKDKNDKKRKTI